MNTRESDTEESLAGEGGEDEDVVAGADTDAEPPIFGEVRKEVGLPHIDVHDFGEHDAESQHSGERTETPESDEQQISTPPSAESANSEELQQTDSAT